MALLKHTKNPFGGYFFLALISRISCSRTRSLAMWRVDQSFCSFEGVTAPPEKGSKAAGWSPHQTKNILGGVWALEVVLVLMVARSAC